jgi:ribosome-binding factor A
MASKRLGRVAEDVKRELSDIFRGLKDPRISPLTTIVKVDVSGDLSYAKIYVSALGGESAMKDTVKGLTSAAGYIRRELGNRLQLRKTPELKFIADNSIEHGANIAKVLSSLDIPEDHEEDEEC